MKQREKPIPDYPLLIILVMFWAGLALQGGCAPDKTTQTDNAKPPVALPVAPPCHNTVVCNVTVSFT